MKDNTEIKIRPATIQDKDFIISLLPRLVEFELPSWRNPDQMTVVDTAILTDKLSNQPEGTAVFVAFDSKDTLLGFIHLQTGHDYYMSEKHGHISDIVVASEGQGKGIGRMLIKKAEEWAHSQGYQWLTLSVFAQNVRARELYEHLGYGQDIMKYVKKLC